MIGQPCKSPSFGFGPALEMVSGHLNTPVGDIVSVSDLAAVLRAGSLSILENQDMGVECLISTVFVETSPKLLLRAAFEAGASVESLASLYKEVRASGAPAIPYWQSLIDGEDLF